MITIQFFLSFLAKSICELRKAPLVAALTGGSAECVFETLETSGLIMTHK